MDACCKILYENEFDKRYAQKELERYHQHGLKNNSKPLFKLIERLNLQGKSLIDIGGGIGSLSFELIKKGIVKSTLVDISEAHIITCEQESIRMGIQHRIHCLQGDFLEKMIEIPAADLVVLDKVICCYAQYEHLIRNSVNKSKKWYAFSLPKDVWWVHVSQGLEKLWNRLKGKSFPTFIHPVKDIVGIMASSGFQKIAQSDYKEWTMMVFEKNGV
jgi:magnesium-protoporphyrin O-methyltransferase